MPEIHTQPVCPRVVDSTTTCGSGHAALSPLHRMKLLSSSVIAELTPKDRHVEFRIDPLGGARRPHEGFRDLGPVRE